MTASRRRRGTCLGYDPHSRRAAFTLVELLVVIGIISVLIAILMPALTQARVAAYRTKCLSNLRQIGLGFMEYANDNAGWFPDHTSWGNCFGTKGSSTIYDPGGPTGFLTDPGITYATMRPLDPYLQQPGVCQCPADLGDTLNADIYNCYQSYGTSYLIQWQDDDFGILHITGDGSPTSRQLPLRLADIQQYATTKIIGGDWNYHPNRPITAARTLWHSRGNQRQMNMVFADGHAEFFTFPPAYDQSPNNGSYDAATANTEQAPVTPNPQNGFW